MFQQDNRTLPHRSFYHSGANLHTLNFIHDYQKEPSQKADITSKKSFNTAKKNAFKPNHLIIGDVDLLFLARQNQRLESDILEGLESVMEEEGYKQESNEESERHLRERIVELQRRVSKKDELILKLVGSVKKMNLVVKRKYLLINYLLEMVKLPKAVIKQEKQLTNYQVQTEHSECCEQETQVQLQNKLRIQNYVVNVDHKSNQIQSGVEDRGCQTNSTMSYHRMQECKIWSNFISVLEQQISLAVQQQELGVQTNKIDLSIFNIANLKIPPNAKQIENQLIQTAAVQLLQQASQTSQNHLNLISNEYSDKYLPVLTQMSNMDMQTVVPKLALCSYQNVVYGSSLSEQLFPVYKLQTEMTETDQFSKQFEQFQKSASESLLERLSKLSDMHSYDEIIKQLQKIQNSQISQSLIKLLQEHKCMRKCLDKMIESQSIIEEEINSQVQRRYSEIVHSQKITVSSNKEKHKGECTIF